MTEHPCTECGATQSARSCFADNPEATTVCCDRRACRKRQVARGLAQPRKAGAEPVWSNDDPVLRPYPLQPLLDRLGPNPSERLKLSGARMKVLRRHGWLTGVEADTMAVAAGMHPSEVGPTWALGDDTAALFEGIRRAS